MSRCMYIQNSFQWNSKIYIPYGSKFSWDNISVNFSDALRITIILAMKILVLHECVLGLWIFQGSVEELPAVTWSGNFPVASCIFLAIRIHLCNQSIATCDVQWASMQSSLSKYRWLPAAKLGTYAMLTSKKERYHIILHRPSAALVKWPCEPIASNVYT